MLDVGLLILRLTVGLLFAAHGAQKLFGWFDGPGIEKHAGWLESLGLRPGRAWAWPHALAELGGGLMLALGLLTPVVSAVLILVMLAAIALVHWPKGLWNMQGGYEYNLVLIAAALTTGLSGAGRYSLDWYAPPVWPDLETFFATLLIGLVVLAVVLGIGPMRARIRPT